jgi:hypothetical protein
LNSRLDFPSWFFVPDFYYVMVFVIGMAECDRETARYATMSSLIFGIIGGEANTMSNIALNQYAAIRRFYFQRVRGNL